MHAEILTCYLIELVRLSNSVYSGMWEYLIFLQGCDSKVVVNLVSKVVSILRKVHRIHDVFLDKVRPQLLTQLG